MIIPDSIYLSGAMKEAGDQARAQAALDGCASVNLLEAVWFEAAIKSWLAKQREGESEFEEKIGELLAAAPSRPWSLQKFNVSSPTYSPERPDAPSFKPADINISPNFKFRVSDNELGWPAAELVVEAVNGAAFMVDQSERIADLEERLSASNASLATVRRQVEATTISNTALRVCVDALQLELKKGKDLLLLAKDSRKRYLLSSPPQCAWDYNGIDGKIADFTREVVSAPSIDS